MASPRFTLRSFFVAATLLCLLAGAVASNSPAGIFAAAMLWAVAGAWRGRGSGEDSAVFGAFAGAAAGALVVFLYWADHIAGYFLSGMPADYFEEDGFVVEVIAFPLVAIIPFASFGLIGGSIIGFVL